MSAGRFTVDLADLEFVLFDQLAADRRLAALPRFAGLDRETCAAALAEAKRLAEHVLAPLNATGDREGCRHDGAGNVATPAGYRAAWDTLRAGGWLAVSAPQELGGGGMPFTLDMAVCEMLNGACLAFMMYPGLALGAGRVLQAHGPPALRDHLARKLYTGEWGGTMCLTEAGAGSSLGDCRCRATPTDDPGVWLLEGEKLFISGADHDLTANIVHLVLARTPNAGPGTRGLSLFMVPKRWFAGDRATGPRNGVRVTRLEEKMGLHGSATCALELGATSPCRGVLIGEERRGLEPMFLMMNEARLGVASQGQAVAAAAYGYARAYARERVQGPAVGDARHAPGAAIVRHPDVRRMLMTLKVVAETTRSLLLRTALLWDLAHEAVDPAERERLRGRVDLWTPVLKATCSELGFDSAVTAVQIHGGYGYVRDYPVEQLVRDAKIGSIYEGTNGIQALDLLGRKLRSGGGALLREWLDDVAGQLAAAAAAGLAGPAAEIDEAVRSLAAGASHLAALGERRPAAALVQAVPFQRMFGLVLLALEALDQAAVARRLGAEHGATARWVGKQRNLEFFAATLLPQALALGRSIRTGDESCLDPDLFTS